MYVIIELRVNGEGGILQLTLHFINSFGPHHNTINLIIFISQMRKQKHRKVLKLAKDDTAYIDFSIAYGFLGDSNGKESA